MLSLMARSHKVAATPVLLPTPMRFRLSLPSHRLRTRFVVARLPLIKPKLQLQHMVLHIFVVRLESPLLHVLHVLAIHYSWLTGVTIFACLLSKTQIIHGLTGVTTFACFNLFVET